MQRLGQVLRNDFWAGPLNVLKPCYKGEQIQLCLCVFMVLFLARFIMLVIGNVCNWALATYALTYHPKNFAVFLLLIFMSNTLLYLIFYIFMKVSATLNDLNLLSLIVFQYLHKERVRIVTWIFLFVSTLCAVTAMYFFLHKAISWSVSTFDR